MPALQVRDFPEDLYEEFAACAKREHRSIAQQTIVAAETYLKLVEGGLVNSENKPPIPSPQPTYGYVRETEEEIQARIAKRKAIFARIDARGPVPGFDAETIVKLQREGREENDRRHGC